ncbi:MAG: Ig-like domain-containing protein, partial [Gemmatimonadetes bacterium]|nr:Ig-like domain-containing protein [Gemmatimonadota bacterium]
MASRELRAPKVGAWRAYGKGTAVPVRNSAVGSFQQGQHTNVPLFPGRLATQLRRPRSLRLFTRVIVEEWMQVFGARTLVRLAWVCFLGLGAVVSCDSPTELSPVVTVTPSGLVTLNVGDTVTVRAVVQNARQPTARFTTSNASIATVDENTGLVRAVTVGDVTITATAVEDPDASASVQIRVNDPPSSILIQQILNPSGGLIDQTRVRGNISVQLAVELGSVARLEVLVDTVVACRQTFLSGGVGAAGGSTAGDARAALATTTTCPINTADFDAVTGVPKFRNGQVVIRARLVGADGRIRSETAGFPMVLANANVLVAQVFAGKKAADLSELAWADGDLKVEVLPVIFEPMARLALAEFIIQPPGTTRVHRRVDTTLPFSVVFQEDSLANYSLQDLRVFIHTATAEGRAGPSLVTDSLRYDNRAPLPGTVLARDWMGAQTTFAERYVGAENADHGGVGRVSARFYVGDPLLSDSALVTRGRLVTRGSELDARQAGSYKTAALVCDALENCTWRSGFRFGVDLNAPTIEKIDLPDRSINPTEDFGLRLEDDLSGFDPKPLEVTVLSLDANPATATCGPGVDGIDLPGRQVGSGCAADSLAPKVP